MQETKTFFDHCKLTNVKTLSNSEFYPYDDLKLNFHKRRTTILYDMFIRFRMYYLIIKLVYQLAKRHQA